MATTQKAGSRAAAAAMDVEITPSSSKRNRSEQVWFKCELRETIANLFDLMGIKREVLDSPPNSADFDAMHQAARRICARSNVTIVSPGGDGGSRGGSDQLDETLMASPPQMVTSPILIASASPDPGSRRSRLRQSARGANSTAATTQSPTPSNVGTRRSAYKYISSPETEDLSDESSSSPSPDKSKTRGKRSSVHRAVAENPAKKAKIVQSEAAQAKKKSQQFSPVAPLSKTATATAAAAKTPVASATTRQAAADKTSQPLSQQTPLGSSLMNNRMNLPNSITKKYHKLQTKKLQKENKNVSKTTNKIGKAANKSVEEARETLTVKGPDTKTVRVFITPADDRDRGYYTHAAREQPCVLIVRLSKNMVFEANRNYDTTKNAAAKSRTKAKASKSTKENERESPVAKKTTAKSPATNVLRANNNATSAAAAAEFTTPAQKRTLTAGNQADETLVNYPVTPFQPARLHDEDNYDVSELHDSEDSESEEEKKPIPSWAKEPRLTNHIMEQARQRLNPFRVFKSCRSEVDLKAIFSTNKKFTRSSSANWNHTPMKEARKSK